VPEVPRAQKNPATRPAAPGRAVVLDIKAMIDGSDTITVTPAGLAWSHKSWQWPSVVQVNGQQWNPKLETILPATGALAFLKQVDLSGAKVLEQTGRGTISMKQTDAGLEIHFDDGEGGAGPYTIQISLPRK
jgi:hypothetical protein